MPRPHPVEAVATVQKIARSLRELGVVSGELPSPPRSPEGLVTLRPLVTGQPASFPFEVYGLWLLPTLDPARVRECVVAASETVATVGPAFQGLEDLKNQFLDDPIGRWYVRRHRYDRERGDLVPCAEHTAFRCQPFDAELLNRLCEEAERAERESRWPDGAARPDHLVIPDGKPRDEADEQIMLALIESHRDGGRAKANQLVDAAGFRHGHARAALRRLQKRGLYQGFERGGRWNRRHI